MGLVFFSKPEKSVRIPVARPLVLNGSKYTVNFSEKTALAMGLLAENGAHLQEVGLAQDKGELYLVYNAKGFPVRKVSAKAGWTQFMLSTGSALANELQITGKKYAFTPFNDGQFFGVKLTEIVKPAENGAA